MLTVFAGRATSCAPLPRALYDMRTPTKGDWGIIDKDDIEMQYAFEMFIGKTQDEAWEMCDDNALNYQEELQSLPEYPFNFYAQILAKYIVSKDAINDADGAGSFLSMVAWMLKTQGNNIYAETKVLLIASAKYVAKNQNFYDAEFDIYGDFKDELEQVMLCASI